jgi:hypothetical protein
VGGPAWPSANLHGKPAESAISHTAKQAFLPKIKGLAAGLLLQSVICGDNHRARLT